MSFRPERGTSAVEESGCSRHVILFNSSHVLVSSTALVPRSSRKDMLSSEMLQVWIPMTASLSNDIRWGSDSIAKRQQTVIHPLRGFLRRKTPQLIAKHFDREEPHIATAFN